MSHSRFSGFKFGDRIREDREHRKYSERKWAEVVKELFGSGEMNQAELAARIGIPKSVISRTLSDLESRRLIIRYENGMSKMVKLADSFKR